MLLGSHLSTSGGLYKALESAKAYGFQALSLFVRSPRQWNAPPLTEEDIETFLETRKTSGVEIIVAHASYLINLAGDPKVRKNGLKAVTEDLVRCDALGIEHLVLHPGSSPDLEEGIQKIAEGLDEAMSAVAGKQVKLLLETTAGQGNSIGHRFEHLYEIMQRVHDKDRYGVCLDTCHIFAAGYDIRKPADWKKTVEAFDKVIGLEHLHAVHCNDSKKPFDSRRDRHEHIGEGEIGLSGFRNLVNDKRFKAIPLILETPKEKRETDGRDWDEVNAETLQGLVKTTRS